MTVFFSQLINGLSLGSIYALIALGYSMVYGIILLLNFAHGDVIMVGAYMSWFVMNQLELARSPLCAPPSSHLYAAGRRDRKRSPTPRWGTPPDLAAADHRHWRLLLFRSTPELILGSGAKVIPAYYTNQTFRLGKVPLGLTSIITLAVTVLSMLGLTFLVQKTKLGKAMRAVSEDMDAARLMGINVNSTISFTFAGSRLAGIGSVLYCCSYPQATPTMGSMLGLKAFVAAVLGGIGSIPGAMIGGIAIGLCECFVSAIGLSAWKDAVTFAILIIVLLVKPTGFLGRKVQEKGVRRAER